MSDAVARSASHPVQGDPAHAVECAHTYRLYVSMASPISLLAIANARRVLQEAFPDTHHLAVLNIADHVEMARGDQIIASPTLLRLTPLPQRRFIGNLSDLGRLRQALGVPALASQSA